MSDFERMLAKEINSLDSVSCPLRLIQQAFEQAKERFNVDDYYDILISLDRVKEIRERLSMIMQRQAPNIKWA